MIVLFVGRLNLSLVCGHDALGLVVIVIVVKKQMHVAL